MKQTAVDWAFEQLDEQVYRIDYVERRLNISISFEDMMTLKKEAKEMEKQQIQEAWIEGGGYSRLSEENDRMLAEQYYKENYEIK
jgi:hypothetical protein